MKSFLTVEESTGPFSLNPYEWSKDYELTERKGSIDTSGCCIEYELIADDTIQMSIKLDNPCDCSVREEYVTLKINRTKMITHREMFYTFGFVRK